MSRFAPFHRVDVTYRVVHGVPVEATILIPLGILTAHSNNNNNNNNNNNKRYPLMVRWHGGGFVVGHRAYEPWFAQWLLDLALDHDAIIVSPDYRLLPEANGRAILDDVAHFWRWLARDLEPFLAQRNLARPDLENVLCCGESSGGFISVYCALHLRAMLRRLDGTTASHHTNEGANVHIRAVISIAAPLDATAPEYRVPRPRVFMGRRPPPPRLALATIRSYIQNMAPDSIRTGCEPTSELWELLLCIVQQALLPRLFGSDGSGTGETTSALESLMDTLGDKRGLNGQQMTMMVPVWLVHGTEDTLVSASIC